MKLYISSYRVGSNPEALSALFPVHAKVAIITNALDFSNDHARRRVGLERECSDLEEISLVPEELDLRHYFNEEESLKYRLNAYDGVWVVGGNTFILRRAMRYSGLDKLLFEMRSSDSGFVYAGYSAGACVLSPSLKGIELIDPPNIVPEGYHPEIVWEGLGFIGYSIVPHYQSDHPESELAGQLAEFFQENQVPHRALRDGEIIVETSK